MKVDHLSSAAEPPRAARPNVRAPARTVMAGEIPNKHILDTSAWNDLANDPDLDLILEKLCSVAIVPTALAIAEIAATEDPERRLALLRGVLPARLRKAESIKISFGPGGGGQRFG